MKQHPSPLVVRADISDFSNLCQEIDLSKVLFCEKILKTV
jgi:hypothetical protein